jgi:hypothetical protein
MGTYGFQKKKKKKKSQKLDRKNQTIIMIKTMVLIVAYKSCVQDLG